MVHSFSYKGTQYNTLLAFLFMIFFGNGLAWGVGAASTESPVPPSAEVRTPADIRHTELRIIFEKQRRAFEDSGRKARKLRESYKESGEALKVARKKLAEIQSGNPKNSGLYYKETQEKPLSASGYFFDQALLAETEAKKKQKESGRALKKAFAEFRNEKRRLLEARQRLKDYDQAVREGWAKNPF